MSNIYEDDDYCKKEILVARSLFTNTNTTLTQLDNVYKQLGIMYLNCNQSIEPLVLATMREIDLRILGNPW